MEVPAKIQAIARQLGENLHRSEAVQAYLAADRDFQVDIAARTLSERLVTWQDELIARQQAGELLSQADVDEFYALRQQAALQPSAMKRQEAFNALRFYFSEVNEELSQYLGADYAAMVDHSHSQI